MPAGWNFRPIALAEGHRRSLLVLARKRQHIFIPDRSVKSDELAITYPMTASAKSSSGLSSGTFIRIGGALRSALLWLSRPSQFLCTLAYGTKEDRSSIEQ